MKSVVDWSAWSRESVRLMQDRNREFVDEFGLHDARYDWSLGDASLVFSLPTGDVTADICVIGSISESERSFLWAWANESIPPNARKRLEEVRAFGVAHELDLLTAAEWDGGRAEGLEVAAIAGRVLDASGIWVESMGDVTMFFALSNFRGPTRGAPR